MYTYTVLQCNDRAVLTSVEYMKSCVIALETREGTLLAFCRQSVKRSLSVVDRRPFCSVAAHRRFVVRLIASIKETAVLIDKASQLYSNVLA